MKNKREHSKHLSNEQILAILNGKASQPEQDAFARKVEKDALFREGIEGLERLPNEVNKSHLIRRLNQKVGKATHQPKLVSFPQKHWLSVAASIILLLVVGFWATSNFTNEESNLAVAITDQTKLEEKSPTSAKRPVDKVAVESEELEEEQSASTNKAVTNTLAENRASPIKSEEAKPLKEQAVTKPLKEEVLEEAVENQIAATKMVADETRNLNSLQPDSLLEVTQQFDFVEHTEGDSHSLASRRAEKAIAVSSLEDEAVLDSIAPAKVANDRAIALSISEYRGLLLNLLGKAGLPQPKNGSKTPLILSLKVDKQGNVGVRKVVENPWACCTDKIEDAIAKGPLLIASQPKPNKRALTFTFTLEELQKKP